MTTTITNRQLMRGYTEWKKKLKNGEVDEIIIRDRKENKEYVLSIRKWKTPFQNFLEKIKKNPLEKLRRPQEDLF